MLFSCFFNFFNIPCNSQMQKISVCVSIHPPWPTYVHLYFSLFAAQGKDKSVDKATIDWGSGHFYPCSNTFLEEVRSQVEKT